MNHEIKNETNTIAEFWQQFEEAAVPAEAKKNQRMAMKNAFYAGAASMLKLAMDIPPETSDDAGAALFRGWMNECVEYSQELVKEVVRDVLESGLGAPNESRH